MEPTVAKAMGVTDAVVAKAVMPTRKSLVPMHEWPVMIEALPVREDPVVAKGPELVMA